MVEVVQLRCQKPDCTSRRTFGFDAALPELCVAHKLDGMVDLMKRRNQVRFNVKICTMVPLDIGAVAYAS